MGAMRQASHHQGSARPLEDHDVPCRLAPRSHRRAMADRGADDGESFRTYVEKVLVPTLRQGDIVIIDNLGSHKGRERSAPPAPSCSSCQNTTRPEPHRASLLEAQASDAQSRRGTLETVCPRSANSSARSPPRNAPTISETQDMNSPKIIMLLEPDSELYLARLKVGPASRLSMMHIIASFA